MALEIVGAGFGRTGTLSLKLALEKLGFDHCYHMREVVERGHLHDWERAARSGAADWEQLFSGYRAAVDWPACAYWETLWQRRPEAKVILSLRESEAWYRSVRSTIYPSSMAACESADPDRRRHGEWVYELIWRQTFQNRFEDRDHAIAVFNAHNAYVTATVPPEQLLVYRPGDGWEPLCAFLGVPVPDIPYPKVNTTAQFQAWMNAQGPDRSPLSSSPEESSP